MPREEWWAQLQMTTMPMGTRHTMDSAQSVSECQCQRPWPVGEISPWTDPFLVFSHGQGPCFAQLGREGLPPYFIECLMCRWQQPTEQIHSHTSVGWLSLREHFGGHPLNHSAECPFLPCLLIFVTSKMYRIFTSSY